MTLPQNRRTGHLVRWPVLSVWNLIPKNCGNNWIRTSDPLLVRQVL